MLKNKGLWIIVLFLSLCNGLSGYCQEICDNAIDDDNDGLVDLNDPDCECVEDIVSEVDIVSSLIPNPSFEKHNCIPNTHGQLNCATGWVQATSPTTDYFHTSGFTSILPPPYPDGQAAVGIIVAQDWQEFVGICLLDNLRAGVEYKLKCHVKASGRIGLGTCDNPVTDPIDITIYGIDYCGTLPLNTSRCPVGTADWEEIAHATYNPNSNWQILEFTFTPTKDFAEIMIGSPCSLGAQYPIIDLTSYKCYPYIGLDNLILNEKSSFIDSSKIIELELNGTGSLCTDDLILTASSNKPNPIWQWYFNGVAIVGQNNPNLDVIAAMGNTNNVGKYSVTCTVNGSCAREDTLIDKTLDDARITVNKACAGEPIELQGYSILGLSNITDWQWDFTSDGTNDGNGQSISFNSSANPITTTLTVTYDNNCISKYSTTINQKEVQLAVDEVVTCTSYTWINGITYHENNSVAQDTLSSVFGCDSIVQLRLTFDTSTIANFVWNEPCEGKPTNFIDISDSGLGQISNWQWTFNNSIKSTKQNPSFIFPTVGTYPVQLIVYQSDGCVDSTQKLVDIFAQPKFTVPSFEEGCGKVCVALEANYTSPDEIVHWQWTFPDSSKSNQKSPLNCFTNATPDLQTYLVELAITSNKGCREKKQVGPVAKVFPQPKANFTWTPNNINLLNALVEFINLSTADVTTNLWEFSNLESSTLSNPEIRFPNDTGRTYFVSLAVKNSFDCRDSTQKMIRISDNHEFYVPNAFTPNNDGINDQFRPKFFGVHPTGYVLTILNRWGNIVYQTIDYTEPWDGSENSSAKQAKSDVYVWVVELLESERNTLKRYQGHVTLLR